MALELNGTTGVSLVQDGVVTAADLASTLDLTGKTVTLPSGTGGKVLQVVTTHKSGEFSTGSGSPVDVTGLNATITPTSTSSKIFILVDCTVSNAATYNTYIAIRRNPSTYLRTRVIRIDNDNQSIYREFQVAMHYSDSPNTTNAVTYQITASVNGNTMYLNRPQNQGGYGDVGISTITLMEIAA